MKLIARNSSRYWAIFINWLECLVAVTFLKGLHILPYRKRVSAGGFLFSRIIAPISGIRRRIRQNLSETCPELSTPEIESLVRSVADNIGRFFVEIFSGDEFLELVNTAVFYGPGWRRLCEAKGNGTPIIAISGHFGNYDVFRGGMISKGYDVGGLYRPMNNSFFNTLYLASIEKIGRPLFARGARGNIQMVRHLREGNIIALLIDQHVNGGVSLTFFGRPASTSTSAAQLAIKYNALIFPVYAIRQPDGITFRVLVENPIQHTDVATMTQQLNDSLENIVRNHMEQWLWSHRRWK